jgi:hypothetical protein
MSCCSDCVCPLYSSSHHYSYYDYYYYSRVSSEEEAEKTSYKPEAAVCHFCYWQAWHYYWSGVCPRHWEFFCHYWDYYQRSYCCFCCYYCFLRSFHPQRNSRWYLSLLSAFSVRFLHPHSDQFLRRHWDSCPFHLLAVRKQN